MVRYGPISIVMAVAMLLVSLATARAVPMPAAEPIPPPNALVTDLLNKLNDGSFAVREDATAQLLNLVKQNLLSPTQLGMIRTFAGQGDLEGRTRANTVIEQWARQQAAINQVIEA